MESGSVLLVTDQYATSKEEDVSTMNRQVVQILTGAGRKFKVYSLVLEDTEEDRKCAEADGVELILPTGAKEDTRSPCLDWLTFDHRTHYPRLPQDVGWIVGHANITSNAATAIKEQRFPKAKLNLVIKTIPENTEKYKEEEKAMGIGKKEDSIRQDAAKADTVFSVGHQVHDHFTNTFCAISEDEMPTHYLFLPEPSDMFQKTKVHYRQTKEKSVLLVSKVNEVEKQKGIDFAAKAIARVADKIQDRIQLRIRGVSEEEYQASMNILQANSGKLIPTLLPHGTQEDICRDMQQAHLVLMPSRTEPFGLIGLEAMAAGVPVLISDQSGVATLVKKVIPEFHHSVLGITGDDTVDVRHWAHQIEKVLLMSEAEFSRAAALKQKLLGSKYWEESHQHFLEAFGCAALNCVQERKKDVGSTKEDNEGRKALELEAPPQLPIVLEILAQIIPSVKTPKQLLSYASSKSTLITIDITKDETLHLLKQIKPEIKTIEDLVNTTEAVKQLSNIKGVSVTSIKTQSLVFYLQCTDLDGLGELWFMCKRGKLNDLLVGSLIGEETLQQLCAESISMKTTINIKDFRKALVYLLITPAAKGQPITRLPQEYPLYQPHTHTASNVRDVLHLDDTNLTGFPTVQHDLHISPTTQAEDSQDHLETTLGKLQIAGSTVPASHRTVDATEQMMNTASASFVETKGRKHQLRADTGQRDSYEVVPTVAEVESSDYQEGTSQPPTDSTGHCKPVSSFPEGGTVVTAQGVSGRNKGSNLILVDFYERGMTRASRKDPLVKEAAEKSGKTIQQVLNFISNYRKHLGESKLRAPTAGDPCSTDAWEMLKHLLIVKVEDDARTDTYNRLATHVVETGLTFREEVPKDGNCMFHAVADQLLRTEEGTVSHAELRKQTVNFLRNNPRNARGEHLRAFIPNQNWNEYLNNMTRDGTWGDHIVLQAMADMLGQDISIVSSVEAENYVTILTPSTVPASRSRPPLLLGHYAENHYASLDKANGGSAVQVSVSTKTALSPSKPGGQKKPRKRKYSKPSDGTPSKQPKQAWGILMVGDEYGTAKGGVSTIQLQVAQFLQRHGARVHCTVLHSSDQDMRLAERDGVQLLRPYIHPDDTRPPSLDWLNFDHQIRYKDIPDNIKCVVGHAGITSKAAKSIKQDRCPGAALVIFHHDMPEDTAYYKSPEKGMAAREKETAMLKDTINADAVFSVGRRIYEHFSTEYKSREEGTKMQHFLFLPKPSPIFTEIEARPGGGEKKVLMFGRVEEMLKQKGHDLAARAMGKVADKTDGVSLVVRGIARDKETWEKNKKALERKLSSRKIKPTLRPYGTHQEIADDIKTAHLVLMPSRSEPFGLVGLEAIAAGIPVLISDQSGLALMILDLIKEKKCDPDMKHRIVETSVCANESELEKSADEWAKKITDTLKHSEHEFNKAAEYKKVLLESRYWEESHQTLLRVCGLID